MLQYSFMQNALIASIFISILCPCVGVFLVFKRHSMIGDTLSHASFAGVAIGILSGFNPVIAAFVFTSVCGIFIEYLRNYYKKYSELILVIILTLCVGIAITIISSGRANANINSYLFGSILTLTTKDLITIIVICIVSITALIILYNQLLYITFDEEGAKITGIKVKLINYLFSLLVCATISVSIRIMGLLVLSSMLAIPAATSLQLHKGFKSTLLYSMLFGFVDIISGLILSYYINCAPGGSIALVSVFTLFAVILYKKIHNLLLSNKVIENN
ncbi:metal ABC transporter permease [Fervidicella metallireducens AeB]|uniref:Metal ABC transporter permease n=1 Tax=Fervidicella metallireducens AeB TaxID=1403537 RepID=A0A017RS42_9CLOT|nr:metal ABC transporter permease [Fervidicella metallireducens]EYE87289.1 metal ABC transporter permease [Fervidicella metallireducens AeB]